jgi:hypothetical protein
VLVESSWFQHASRHDMVQCPLLRPLHSHTLGFLIPATIGLVVGKLRALFSRQYRVERRYLYFDAAAMESLKQQAVAVANKKDANVAFVSSNDVITSWAFCNARCRHGFMVANWRGRVDGYTDRLAGNYFTDLYYDLVNNHAATASTTPSTIRRSIVQCTASTDTTATTADHVSAAPLWWLSGPFIVTSNLAGYSSNITVTLPGDNCRQGLHAPVMGRDELDMHPAHFVFGLVFRAQAYGQLAMMLCGSPSRLDDLTEICPFVAKPKAL